MCVQKVDFDWIFLLKKAKEMGYSSNDIGDSDVMEIMQPTDSFTAEELDETLERMQDRNNGDVDLEAKEAFLKLAIISKILNFVRDVTEETAPSDPMMTRSL